MIEDIKIKKELTKEEFTRICHKFQKSIEKQTDARYLSKSFQELAKQVTPAKKVQLLLVSEPNKMLKTTTLEKNITINISSSKSMLAKCYQTKKALFSNDVKLDNNYNQDIDNFFSCPLKNLLLLPLLNSDNEVEGIVWAGISQEDWNQYTQCDIDYMTQVCMLDEKITIEKEEYQKKPKQTKPEQESTQNRMGRLKSWLLD